MKSTSTMNGSANAAPPVKLCPGLRKYYVPAHPAPLSAFNRNRSTKDGLSRTCRDCGRRWRVEHKARGGRSRATTKANHTRLGKPAPMPAPAVPPAAPQPTTVRAAFAALLVALAHRVTGRTPMAE